MKVAVALAFGYALFAFAPAGAAQQTGTNIATTSAPTALYALNPFLVGVHDLGDIDLPSFLSGNPNLASYAAKNLVADGTSAAIVLFQTDKRASVTFTVNSAASLLPYSATFLKRAPITGQPSLTVSGSRLLLVGANYYAAVLVQGPLAGYSSDNSIAIQVTQNSTQSSATLGLIVPPVLLVHGLWGDKASLADVGSYLDSVSPWRTQTKLVQAICYSQYIAFDAKTDPLTDGKNPCEVTSQDAVQTEIDALLAELDEEGSVGGRVDLVVHSMGGLVARSYASQSHYASLRNRMQGQFHVIVTLDTPETGSLLAPYLISVRNDKSKAPIWTTQGIIWHEVCGDATVATCFAANDDPIYSSKLTLDSGAVYALTPGGAALSNPKLSGPNIANSTWRAVSALAPHNSALEYGLNALIAALYSNPGASDVPTLNSILQNLPNDGIVTLASQINGAAANQYYTFPNLSHTSLVGSVLTYLSGDDLNDNSVTHDPSGQVYKLAACWLETTGANSCLPAKSQAMEREPATVSQHFKPVDRIEVESPVAAELGKPLELTVRLLKPGFVPRLFLYEQGEQGRTLLEPVVGVRVAGNLVYASVVPKFLGPVRLSVRAAFADGGVSGRSVSVFVAPPKAAPLSFQANELPTLVLDLDASTTSVMPHPQALYPSPVGEVYLNSRFVTYRLVPERGHAVIRIEPNGLIHAIAPGKAFVEAHFGSVSDRLQIVVRASQQ